MQGTTTHTGRREHGAAALEYVGMTIAAALVAAAVIGGVVVADFGQVVSSTICKVFSTGGGSCDESGTGGSEDDGIDYGGIGTEGEDPGDDVEYPEGLDPESEIAQELASTARGRRILQWLHDNDVEIVIDPGATGAFYSDGVITLGPGHTDAGTVIHEANHAVWDEEDRHADAESMGKEDYVSLAIQEEAEGVWLEVVYAKERRESGQDVEPGIAEERYDDAYQPAYDAAIASGQTPAQAHAAADQDGLTAIEQMFYDGTYVTSNTGDPYSDYYGDYWESVN